MILSQAKELLDQTICRDNTQVWLVCDSTVCFELRWKSWLKGLAETESLSGRRFYFNFTSSFVNVLIDPVPKRVCGLHGDLVIVDGAGIMDDVRHLLKTCVNRGGKYAEVV